MKFAENNRISHRQLYRQMVLAFLAPFLLCLLGNGRVLGISGILGIVGASALLLIYTVLLVRMAPGYGDLVKSMGAVCGRLAGVFFLIYALLGAAFLTALAAELVPAVLVTGIPGQVIAVFVVAVCSFGTHKGMQRRGRMAEVSGGLLLGGVLLMMILCLGQSNLSYLREMGAERVAGAEVVRSGYGVLCGFAGIGLLPFALKDVEKRGSAGRPVALGILTLGGILTGMLLLLPAVFGWQRLKSEAYPVLPLLAGADLPGNVLARFDVLWMGFLLYSLLFAVGSLFHYGHQIIARAHLGSGRWWMPAAVLALAIWEFGGKGAEDLFGRYLGYVFVPGMLLIQVFMALRVSRKRRKKAVAVAAKLLVIVLPLSLLLTGCAAIEPEKRMYPLALGADRKEGSGGEKLFSLIYGMPDLPQSTGQEKAEEEKSPSVLAIEGANFGEIEAGYDRSQEKYLDMSHLQVILLSDRLLNDGWQEFLAYLDQDPFVGENVYLFRTADPEAVLAWDSGGTSIGEYLTGLLENRLPSQQKEGVTLRQAYHQWYQNQTLSALPAVVLEDEEIQVYLE